MDRLCVSVLCVCVCVCVCLCVCVCVCTKSNYLILHSIGYLEYGMETLQRDRLIEHHQYTFLLIGLCLITTAIDIRDTTVTRDTTVKREEIPQKPLGCNLWQPSIAVMYN